MKRLLPLLLSLGCGSADSYSPSPGEASPEPQREAIVCGPSSDDYIAWQSEGLTHVSRKAGTLIGGASQFAVTQHYDRETPFEADFQGVSVLVSSELDVCVE